MTTVTVRVDEITKKKAAEVAADFGFDLSTITRAFWKQMARERIIPLDVTTPLPNEESLRSIQEAEDFLNSNKPGYTDIEKLFNELDA